MEVLWLTCDICEKKLSTNTEFRSIYVDMKVQSLIVIHPSIYLFMKNNIVETSKMTVEQDAQGTYNAR